MLNAVKGCEEHEDETTVQEASQASRSLPHILSPRTTTKSKIPHMASYLPPPKAVGVVGPCVSPATPSAPAYTAPRSIPRA